MAKIIINQLFDDELGEVALLLAKTGNTVESQIFIEKIKDADLRDIFTCRLLARLNQLDDALKLAEAFPKNKQTSVYRFISDSLAESGQFDQALEIARKLPLDAPKEPAWYNLRFSRNHFTRNEAFNWIIHNSISRKEFDLPLEIANSLPPHDKDYALLDIAIGLAKNREFSRSLEVANKIFSPHTQERAFKELSKIYTENDQLDNALEMANLCDNLRDDALWDIWHILANNYEWDKALTVIQMMKESKTSLSTLSQKIADKGKFDKALFDKAIRVAEMMQEWSYAKEDAFSYISELLAESGYIDQAVELAMRIPQGDRNLTERVLSTIVRILLWNKNFDKALEVLSKMPVGQTKQSTAGEVVEALSLNKKFDKALDVADMMPEGKSKEKAFLTASQQLVNEGLYDQAIAAVDRAPTLPRSDEKDNAFVYISNALAKEGLFKQAIKVAHMSGNKKNVALEFISKAMAKNHQFSDAIDVANDIDKDFHKRKVLEYIQNLRNTYYGPEGHQ